jgi:hypothetical protein
VTTKTGEERSSRRKSAALVARSWGVTAGPMRGAWLHSSMSAPLRWRPRPRPSASAPRPSEEMRSTYESQ